MRLRLSAECGEIKDLLMIDNISQTLYIVHVVIVPLFKFYHHQDLFVNQFVEGFLKKFCW